jgi:HPt (histidine-containing phosphotransfer) domain-containing protein
VADFRAALKSGISDRLLVIDLTIQALGRNKLSFQLQQKAEYEAHKLVGTLGSVGFAEGSQIAQEIEILLGEQNCCDRTHFLRLNKLVKELRHQIEIAPTEIIDFEDMPK